MKTSYNLLRLSYVRTKKTCRRYFCSMNHIWEEKHMHSQHIQPTIILIVAALAMITLGY